MKTWDARVCSSVCVGSATMRYSLGDGLARVSIIIASRLPQTSYPILSQLSCLGCNFQIHTAAPELGGTRRLQDFRLARSAKPAPTSSSVDGSGVAMGASAYRTSAIPASMSELISTPSNSPPTRQTTEFRHLPKRIARCFPPDCRRRRTSVIVCVELPGASGSAKVPQVATGALGTPQPNVAYK